MHFIAHKKYIDEYENNFFFSISKNHFFKKILYYNKILLIHCFLVELDDLEIQVESIHVDF